MVAAPTRWRRYHHFVRYHESLAEELTEPVSRKGKQYPRKYRWQTLVMLAGLTDQCWTVNDLVSNH